MRTKLCSKKTSRNGFYLLKSLQTSERISFSPHVTVYAHLVGCDPRKLRDEKFVTSVIFSSIVLAKMKLLDFHLRKFEGGGEGITAVAIISDSHIIVNTFPETTSLILDVYACSGYPILVMKEFVRKFKPKSFEYVILPRSLKDEQTRTKVILSENSIEDSELKRWLQARNLLPLLNNSEECLILANFIGFLIANGKLEKDFVLLREKNKYVLEIMKEKLKRINVDSSLVVKENYFDLIVKDENFRKLLNKLEINSPYLPKWLKNDGFMLSASFLSSFLFSKLSRKNGNFELKVRDFEFGQVLRKMLNRFYIKSSIEERGGKPYLKIDPNERNINRLEALLSLSKIFPIGFFDLGINLKIKPSLNNRKELYKLIRFLIINEKAKIRILEKLVGKNFKILVEKLLEANIIARDGDYVYLKFNS